MLLYGQAISTKGFCMNILVAHNREECLAGMEKRVDIIVLANRLFGFYVFTTNQRAMTAIYTSYKWREALLANVSWFFIPLVTLSELLGLIRESTKEMADTGKPSL